MVDTVYGVNAVSGAPSYSGKQYRQANASAYAGATAARPLGGRTGVRPGTSVTTVTATSTVWTCGPFAGVADVETAVEASVYPFAFDANATGAVTAAHATLARKDIIYVQIDDPAESDGSSVPAATRKYLAGTASGSPVAPATPVTRAFVIAVINVPASGGGSPTVTWVAPYMAAAGGVVSVADATERDAVSWPDGQLVYQRDIATLLTRAGGAWDNLWISYTPALSATGTTPAMGASTLTGEYRRNGKHVDVQINFMLGAGATSGTGSWRFSVPFVSAAGRTAVPAHVESALVGFYPGMGYIEAGNSFIEQIAYTASAGVIVGAGSGLGVNSKIAFSGRYKIA